ncbi:MAG: PA0069 family radical SAM protein [Sphingomonadaceae bacterium]|uniref:PA0069 family radical SAM protein n=1 Tax=Thermaurantiacus sp. TaxID=2820283 RepID=UPI00298F0725|nr:PA0069 family radical SAM protein [Thermaurantiacus sp.]MCS6987072.1 PA0069 family radical SAM protein [Sphingomonadaceae bacterium]MDW8415590.1 PA0069 family radical SAM protein [Thermaurantiacus sp.]
MARRGATANPVSARFGDPERRVSGEFRDWLLAAEGERPLRTEVVIERPRSVLTRNDSPDIPFDRSFNAYRGCEHGCIYCFARPTHAFHGLSPGLDFESRLFAKPDGPALLRRAFARPGYRVDVLAMGTNTDPYQPIERRFRITRAVLELCRETGHPVAITTKSDRCLRDLDLLGPLARRGLARVMISLTTLDPALARVMEPRAPGPHRRLAAIRGLAQAGVPVVVSASPMIPGLNDHELEAIVEAAAAAGAVAAAAIPIRLPHEVAPLFAAWLHHHRPARAQRVLNAIRAMRGGRLNDPRFGHRMRADGPWGQLLEARLAAVRRRCGLDRPLPALDTSQFVPPADPRQPRLL